VSAPRISVVVTTYNRSGPLATTLDSLLAQSVGDFELIISDDCSPDDTEQVGRAYERRDRRVRYRRNQKNLRMPGNLNAGIAEARGAYIANLHDGDVYRPDLLEKWAGALDRHPKAAFVFNQYQGMAADGSPKLWKNELPECIDGRVFLLEHFTEQWGSPVFGTVMARKACYDAVGPFDPAYSFNSDIEMWVRLALRYDVAYVAEPLIHVSPREKQHLMSKRAWWELTVDVRVKRLALAQLGAAPARRRRFERRARAHYAWQALPALRHARWNDAWTALRIAATGRDDVPPPY
jgi:glycosyltransferase involved in cell wall biosynthesis